MSLITRKVHLVVIIDEIGNINGLGITTMVKVLDNKRKRPDPSAATYEMGEQKCSKPKVTRKFSVSWEKSRSW